MSEITVEQLGELIAQSKPGKDGKPPRITRENLQAYLRGPNCFLGGLPTTYDCSLGLRKLIELAVGEHNLKNINSAITQERFPLKGTGVRTVNLRVEPFLNNETGEQAANRLTAAGHILANTGDLAGFQHDHPKEVEKWGWVVALSEDFRWTDPVGNVMVPCAYVLGALRDFRLAYFRFHFYSSRGVLVRCEPACR